VFFAGVLLVLASGRDRRRSLPTVAVATSVAIAVCGFWYAKNAVRHGNPVYPLVLGHRGVSDEEYRSLVAALQHFGPRTIDAFVHLPARFSRPLELPTFFLFFAAPAAILVRRRGPMAAALAAYFALYVAYWFFLASHQRRFLLPAFFAGSIAVAIVAFAGGPATRSIALVSATLGLFALHPASTLTRRALVEDVKAKLSVSSLSYAAGQTTRDAFLADRFGCQYRVVRYLPRHDLDGRVVDNWTRWFGYNLAPYTANQFAPLPPDLLRVNTSRAKQALTRHGFRYLYVRTWDKRQFALTSDPIIRRWRRERLPLETRLLRDARVVYRADDCSLYRLTVPS
jgi:hypothetical protein